MARAIAALDFVPNGAEFADWAALDKAIDEIAEGYHATHSWPGAAGYTVSFIKAVLDACESSTEDHSAFAFSVLRESPAAKDPEVYDRLLRLAQGPTARIARPELTEARRRVHEPLAA